MPARGSADCPQSGLVLRRRLRERRRSVQHDRSVGATKGAGVGLIRGVVMCAWFGRSDRRASTWPAQPGWQSRPSPPDARAGLQRGALRQLLDGRAARRRDSRACPGPEVSRASWLRWRCGLPRRRARRAGRRCPRPTTERERGRVHVADCVHRGRPGRKPRRARVDPCRALERRKLVSPTRGPPTLASDRASGRRSPAPVSVLHRNRGGRLRELVQRSGTEHHRHLGGGNWSVSLPRDGGPGATISFQDTLGLVSCVSLRGSASRAAGVRANASRPPAQSARRWATVRDGR